MGKWPMVRLGDVCEFSGSVRGAKYPSGKDFRKSGVPFIAAENLSNGSVVHTDMKYITEQKYDELESGKIRNGDWLYSLRGEIGVQVIAEGFDKAAVASSVVLIRPKNVLASYLRHCMNSGGIRGQQREADNGIVKPNLAATDVRNFVIPLPPLPVQHEIAEALEPIFAAIGKRRAQIEELNIRNRSAESGSAESGSAESGFAECGGAESSSAEYGRSEYGGAESSSAESSSATDSLSSRLRRSLERFEMLYESRMEKCFEGELLAPPAGYTGEAGFFSVYKRMNR